MDLRRSSPPSSHPVASISIPAARSPFPSLAPGRKPAAPIGSTIAGTPSSARRAEPALRLRHLVNLAEGAFVLIGAYILIGAGIGEAAGSVLVGVAAGLVCGVCAIAAILLISGSARASQARADRVPRRVPQAR